ncbi:ABC transporter substrate-binding protein [Alkalibacter rhizosphaerae]|uniref:ABC transporter substrate-binding protein n=1 Tax=Alkalibacter rhizosphaerae TaxID=2815577 RepID=A0A974XJ83_9FIRM|nr:ABC transporter substrate-binding protein [Alkalibacter rhizosphaerae]QSX09393.1 ABC transporter substrate-binding protein [Alkalibacter rhizosphaerae]
MNKRNRILLVLLIFMFLMQGCSSETDGEKTIRIAEQYGIAYAPVQVMKEMKYIEEELEGATVVWEQLANTAAIREAMIAGELDVGFMAIPPFLIGWDKGMDWKIATGLSYVPVGLVAKEEIPSLEGIGSEHRIALPQPGSVQHILLSMASKREFGDPKRFDDRLVTLSHPDGVQALFSGSEVSAHFTSTPYLEQELDQEGFHLILDGKEAFGQEFSFIIGATTADFHEEDPEAYQAFVKGIQKSVDYINEKPREAAALLTKYYDMDEDTIYGYLTDPEAEFSTTAKGMKRFGDFMLESEYIEKMYGSVEEILWEGTLYEE